MLYVIVILVIIILIFVLSKSSKKKENIASESSTYFPDRSFDIQFLQNKVAESIEKGEIDIANLNFAKLVESVRQQNENQNGQLQELLDSLKSDYSDFRNEYGLDYPQQFLPPKERTKTENKTTSQDPSELLKQATSLSNTDINEAIGLINKAIKIEPENFAAHKKLANYMFQAGQKADAISYLLDYSKGSDIFHKSESLDQIAILLKKDKQNLEAIKYDCKSTYYYTMIQGPMAYNNFEGLCESLVLKRKYKEDAIEEKINTNMIEFWGKDWLSSYYKEYRKVESSVSYDLRKTIKKMEPYFAQKRIEDFEKFINELVTT